MNSHIDEIARETNFSGVVSVDRAGVVEFEAAYGFANRAEQIANTTETRFALASGSKGFTALAVMGLVEDGILELTTPVRTILADDLPLIDDGVTVEHLLAHRSGIGDYIDEDLDGEKTDYVMPVSVHELVTTEDFLAVLDGFPQKFAPGTDFSYCNGGFMVLALVAERASGIAFHDLIRQRVTEPAGMHATEFLRSDELPGGTALGYLDEDGLRTNVFHLPVRGNGDGGVYSTVADIRAFWPAFFGARIVGSESVAAMVRPRSTLPSGSYRYGLGFWLDPANDGVQLEGADAGVSFRSVHDPATQHTYTVISNWTDGAWPVLDALTETR